MPLEAPVTIAFFPSRAPTAAWTLASCDDTPVSGFGGYSLRRVGATVTLEAWGSGDLPLLERLMGDPRMTEHLGGPETPEKLRERQSRYERLEGGDRMFKIVDTASGAGVGSVGYWTKDWRDEDVYEIGWMVVPEFQGPRHRSGGDRKGGQACQA